MILLTDRQLLDCYLRGDDSAFAELVRRHIAAIHRAAARMAPGHGDDVTQAVFLLLSQKASALKSHTCLAGWLYRATRYCCRHIQREETRRKQREQEAVVMSRRSAPEPDTDLVVLLDDALESLRVKERQAVLLRYLEGHSLEASADLLGISIDAASKRATRGVERLRRYFAKAGCQVSAATVPALLSDEATHRAGEQLISLCLNLPHTGASMPLAIVTAKAFWMMKVKVAAALTGIVVVGAATATLLVSSVAHGQQPPAPPPPAASTPAPAPDSPFQVTLPGGLRVEVVGISYHPSAGRPWWRPDGSPLTDRPYQQMRNIILSGASPDNAREFAVRIVQPAEPATVIWTVVNPSPDASGRGSPTGLRQADLGAQAAVWNAKAPDTVSLVFSIAAGAWQTKCTGQPTVMATSSLFGGSFAFSEPCEIDGETRIAVADNYMGFDHRIVAVDQQGKPHPASNSPSAGAATVYLTSAHFANLPLAQIREIQVQIRPFDTRIQFDNLAMTPGQKTDLKTRVTRP